MYKNYDWVYISIIILCLVLSLFIYKRVEASLLSRLFTLESKPSTIIKPIKTLDSEIDRLAIKYNVSSSTVRAVAKCESQMYGNAVNHNRDSNGVIWSTDKGYLQINDYYHQEPMRKLGLDIDNEWDSLEYGFMLMANQGLKPWSASRHCWSKLI